MKEKKKVNVCIINLLRIRKIDFCFFIKKMGNVTVKSENHIEFLVSLLDKELMHFKETDCENKIK